MTVFIELDQPGLVALLKLLLRDVTLQDVLLLLCVLLHVLLLRSLNLLNLLDLLDLLDLMDLVGLLHIPLPRIRYMEAAIAPAP